LLARRREVRLEVSGPKAALVRDVPEKELAEARKSKEYSQGYDSMKKKFETLPIEEALGTCRAFVQNEK
jgi:hypothetical protein